MHDIRGLWEVGIWDLGVERLEEMEEKGSEEHE